jgi:nitroimidazol reductase NimA-like FMN-containing flavoprotein (pyridoxamine 5'-phosphate oxidase superfamily)
MYHTALKVILADRHARPLSKREVVQLLARPNILRLAYIANGQPVVHAVWHYYRRANFLSRPTSIVRKLVRFA